jgi:gamma-glutamyl:cysteine ligase YbdK (ATP-grasp superfamily)
LRGGELRLEVRVCDPLLVLEPLRAVLLQTGATLLELRHELPTLEQVFMEHTAGVREGKP